MLLSIIVPAKNEEKTIGQTLKQLHDNLTGIEHEIILTDDESTDRTREIAAHYATVTVHKNVPGRRTIAANRNHGASVARGNYFAFIDADIFVPDPEHFFKKLLADFAEHPTVVAITVKIEIMPEEASWVDRTILFIVNFMRWWDNNIWHNGSASGEFQMIKREAFEQLHGYNERMPIAEDNELFSRLAGIGRTRVDWDLVVYTHNRRQRQVGWSRLMWLWLINYLYMKILKRSYSKEWPPK